MRAPVPSRARAAPGMGHTNALVAREVQCLPGPLPGIAGNLAKILAGPARFRDCTRSDFLLPIANQRLGHFHWNSHSRMRRSRTFAHAKAHLRGGLELQLAVGFAVGLRC